MTNSELVKIYKLFILFHKRWHNKHFYTFQKDIAIKILQAVFKNTGEDLYIQVSRQAGKTDVLVAVVEFLMIVYPKIKKKPIRIGIFAPQKEQAKTDFDRLKQALLETSRAGFKQVIDPDESNAVTLQLGTGSYCYIFPLTATSNPESKTLDLVIYEEANGISDKEKKNKSDPMRASTNAPSVSVGVGGYEGNYFKKAIDRNVNVFKYPYNEVIKERRAQFEIDNNPFHLNYELFIDKIIQDVGLDDDAFRAQFGLEFIIGGGTFTTREELDTLVGDYDIIKKSDEEAVFGLDTAKFPDRTVCTVKGIETGRIFNWLVLQGDNYENQYYTIEKWLANYNIIGGAIDSTGQGDFMPDMFENHSDYNIERVKFSLQSKDIMGKNLQIQIRTKGTKIPKTDCKERRLFDQEVLDLVKEYKGEYLSLHHPDEPEAHDDFVMSWALAEYAHKIFTERSPDVHIISSKPLAKQTEEVDNIDNIDDLIF
jgi:hypothetical protein